MSIKVKALMWDEIHYNRSAEEPVPELVGYEAESVCGFYSVKFEFSIDVALDGITFYKIGSFDEIDEAKAAAQADYERRILSAIEPSPDMREAVEALTTAVHAHYVKAFEDYGIAREVLQADPEVYHGALDTIATMLRSLTGAKP